MCQGDLPTSSVLGHLFLAVSVSPPANLGEKGSSNMVSIYYCCSFTSTVSLSPLHSGCGDP